LTESARIRALFPKKCTKCAPRGPRRRPRGPRRFTDEASRPERKSALYQCCADWRSNPELRASGQTDLLPLTTKLPAP